ncbi:CTP synthase [Babesia gibsoni]|uniref:CTP synthase n=1 Tax=Babesia gibsoni TaxID=33632 RepID=A0AAD8PDP4_BABGI|nr:CTP synthase [Babesia gibsoni]
MKYVAVVGGTMSGIGKGTVMSSIGVLIRSYNISCTAIKIDPYLNLDAGTMSPHEHGEVFVLDDGGEGDLDLGNYERFLNIKLTRNHSITTGKIFCHVFEKERRGCFLGKTVQMVPHVVEEIIDWIQRVAEEPVDRIGWRNPEVCLLEIGGTVGDIESEIFMEALRQMKLRLGSENLCIVHLSWVPQIGSNNEHKSKPTQHSAKDLLVRGLQPDMIFGRCNSELPDEIRQKIGFFTQVNKENVISVHNASEVYEVPFILEGQHVAQKIFKQLNITPVFDPNFPKLYSLQSWGRLTLKSENLVTIALVGKYNSYTDAYLSVANALKHAAMDAGFALYIKFVDSESIEEDPTTITKAFEGVEGVVVPGGFGERGLVGKGMCSCYCRKNRIPFLGICLGLQLAILDAAKEFEPEAVHGEVDEAPEDKQAIIAMPEFIGTDQKGGSMRLGIRETFIKEDSLAFKLYDHQKVIMERFRHRYEINPAFTERLEKLGFVFTGLDVTGRRRVIFELPSHPYFVGTQFHPEFMSTPFKPSPPFLGLILASKGQLNARLEANNGKLLAGGKYEMN